MRDTSTQYDRPYRPWAVRAYNRVGGRGALDAAELLRCAVRRSHAHYFGADGLRDRLELLVESLAREARLHALGRLMARENLLRVLVNRLRAEALFDRHPELTRSTGADPIVIVGLQRTGTTLLHRLLACDPGLRVLESWEALNPAPASTPAGALARLVGRSPDPRLASAVVAERAVRYLAPDFFAVHPIDARAPEEECLLFDLALLGTVPEATYRVPTFAHHLETLDHVGAYRFLAQMLALLHWQRPAERWLLKTPQHLEHLDALLTVFPGARVVHLHRDPAQALPSFFSMIAHAWGVFSDDVRPAEVVAHWGRKTERMVARALAVRDGPLGGAFQDVHYRELVADPLGTVERIYAALPRPLTPTTRAAMERYLAANPRHKHGRHVYDAGAFGCEPAALRRRFAAYIERFGVEAEP